MRAAREPAPRWLPRYTYMRLALPSPLYPDLAGSAALPSARRSPARVRGHPGCAHYFTPPSGPGLSQNGQWQRRVPLPTLQQPASSSAAHLRSRVPAPTLYDAACNSHIQEIASARRHQTDFASGALNWRSAGRPIWKLRICRLHCSLAQLFTEPPTPPANSSFAACVMCKRSVQLHLQDCVSHRSWRRGNRARCATCVTPAGLEVLASWSRQPPVCHYEAVRDSSLLDIDFRMQEHAG